MPHAHTNFNNISPFQGMDMSWLTIVQYDSHYCIYFEDGKMLE